VAERLVLAGAALVVVFPTPCCMDHLMKVSLLALLGSVAYATARYNVFKGVPWRDWPIYTLNKAFALSALLVLALSVIRRAPAPAQSHAHALRMAGVFGSMHVMLSLILLSPAYFDTLFVRGTLTTAAGLSMLLGAAASALMASGFGRRGDQMTETATRIIAAAVFVIGLHAMLQGYRNWFMPSQWPGMMPPITLISFLLGLAAAAAAVTRRLGP
jgi:hypothetical protein